MIKEIKAKDIFPMAKEFLDNGKRIRITVTGNSMYPFLRDSKDSVLLTKTDYKDVKRGDILLVLQDDGTYIMHRLVKKKSDYFYINGDASNYREGPMYPEQIIAKVRSIFRGEYEIECNRPMWKGMSLGWFLVLPFRRIIIRGYFRVSKMIKFIKVKE